MEGLGKTSIYLDLGEGRSSIYLPDYPEISDKEVAFVISGEDRSTLIMTEFDPNIGDNALNECHIVFHGYSGLYGWEARKVPCLCFKPEDVALINEQNAHNRATGQSPMVLYVRDGQVKVFSNKTAFEAYCSGQIER